MARPGRHRIPSAPAGYGLAPAKLPVWYCSYGRSTMTATSPVAPPEAPHSLAASVHDTERPAAVRPEGPGKTGTETLASRSARWANSRGTITAEEHPGHRRAVDSYGKRCPRASGLAQSGRRRTRHRGPQPPRMAQHRSRNQSRQGVASSQPKPSRGTSSPPSVTTTSRKSASISPVSCVTRTRSCPLETHRTPN